MTSSKPRRQNHNGVFEAAEGGTLFLAEIGEVPRVGAFTARASRGGTKGLLKTEKASVSAAGPIVIETGSEGTTEEKDNALTSGTSIRVATGSSGSCSSGSSLNAPVVQACQ